MFWLLVSDSTMSALVPYTTLFRSAAGRPAGSDQLGGTLPQEGRAPRSLGPPVHLPSAGNSSERFRPHLLWPRRSAGRHRRRRRPHQLLARPQDRKSVV